MAGRRGPVNRSAAGPPPRNGRTVTGWRGRQSVFVTAGGGTRTHTDLRPGAFEAPSSTIPTLRQATARGDAPPRRVYPSTLRWELIGNVSVSRQESQRSRPGEPGPPGRSGGLYPVDRAISGSALQHGAANGWWPRRRRRHRAGGLSARLGKDSDAARRALQVVAVPDRRESLL